MIFLITRPEHDHVVFYLSKWSEELINKAEIKGINVIDCKKEKVTKKEVGNRIKKKDPIYMYRDLHELIKNNEKEN